MDAGEPREPREPGPGAETAAAPRWEEAKTFCDNLTPKKKPKSPKPENAVTIAVSSRALFRMDEEQRIYMEQGVEEYVRYQLEHENEPFSPGPAFPFVKALEAVNRRLRELYPDSEDIFDIVLVTNNHAQVGVRLINSINHYDLFIERFCMTGGNSPICYLKAYHTNLYLSADAEKVQEAIDEGIAAATIFSPSRDMAVSQSQLRVAFDGDAVLFSDESERIVKAHGLDRFFEHEKAHENKPLAQVLHTLPRTPEWSKAAPQNLPLAGTSSPEPNSELGPESNQVSSPSLQPSSLTRARAPLSELLPLR